MGLSLLGVLALSKILALWDRPMAWSASTVLGFVWQDVLVALIFTAIETIASRWRHQRRITAALYWLLTAHAAVNVVVVRVLGTPVTWPMLRATRGALADSIVFYLTWPNAALMLAVVAAAAVLARPHRDADRQRATAPERYAAVPAWAAGSVDSRHVIGMALMLAIALAGALVVNRVDTAGLHRNPLMALAASTFPRVRARAADEDWTAPLFEHPPADDLSRWRGLAAGRNVVLVSLESTAAQYLRLYGGTDDLTPRLDELARSALVFENAYAATPESIKGLFSVLCSRYPAFDTPITAYAATSCSPVADVLATAGYRTALFHSGRFAYLGMEAVVRNRGFAVLEDAGDIGGHRESSFGVDEPATVDRMLAWIDGLARDQRFLLVYLPIAGHHPYATPERGPFPDGDEFGRYRNAIRHGDASLGTLVDGLRARGLDDQTLWIVYGDHGQAFGQHVGNHGHTFFLYEENVRVPFLVAAPGAIAAGTRSRTTLSLVDTAPTMLDLLGLPIPAAYQGRSALDGRPRTALFFTEYSLSLVGLRDGRWKFLHDLSSRRSTLFDLERDPAETIDISSHHPARVAAYTRTLQDWSAAQKALMQGG